MPPSHPEPPHRSKHITRYVAAAITAVVFLGAAMIGGRELAQMTPLPQGSTSFPGYSAMAADALAAQRMEEAGATSTPATIVQTVPPRDVIVPPSEGSAKNPTPTPADSAQAVTDSSQSSTAPATPQPSSSGNASLPSNGSGNVAVSVDPRVGDDFILVSRARLVSLPTSGPAWAQMKAVADGDAGMPDLSDNSQDNNVRVLAKALVFARTGEGTYRAEVVAQLKSAVGTEGTDTLALAREAAAYALSADFIDLGAADPGFDQNVFRPWLRSLLTVPLDGRTLRSTHEERANNWGTHAGASRAAIAAYLGDANELARTAQVFRGWLGDRNSYSGFTYNDDRSWQSDPDKPVGINPVGATIDGVNVDGALPEEMRRGSSFRWPPAQTDYPWGALEGAVLQAEILQRYGYDTFSWGDRALLRAVKFLFEGAGWRPAGNDQWIFWVLDYRYGSSYRAPAPVPPGKNFGWTDWLYGS